MSSLDDPNRLDSIGLHATETEPDEVLNEYVREAARYAKTPIALVSIIMSHIQYFRASVGLSSELEASRATSRCTSFCQFVVIAEAPFIVSDAKNDPRVPQDMVEVYDVQAYAGVPVRQGGQVLGSLCVVDTKPREFKSDVIEALERIAAKVSRRLETLKEQKDSREAQAMRPKALSLRLTTLLTKAQAIEAALTGLDALLDALKDADSFTAGVGEGGASSKDIVELYGEVEEDVRALRDGVLHVADALELRGALVDAKTLDSFRSEARELYRGASEIGPFARLIRSLSSSSVSSEAFDRGVGVLGEALGVGRAMLATLKRLRNTGDRIAKKVTQAS